MTWIEERIQAFVPAVEPLTLADEERIKMLCEEEIQSWRERPGMKSKFSLKEPVRRMRNALRKLDLTEENSYFNERREMSEHIALRYFTLGEGEWSAMNEKSAEKFHAKLVNQLMIRCPEEIIARIERLLQSRSWQEVAAGLVCATGRRLSEVLTYGEVRPVSQYSVDFTGQRKSKSEEPDEYEIPTLVLADLVIEAWKKLRALRDFSVVESDQLSASFGPAVKEVVQREFADLIDQPLGRAALYSHVLRAVYPRLAIYFFLPDHVQEVAFVSEILGHKRRQKDGQTRPNYNATLYYMSYKICDEQGVIDGRSGVKLTEPGVEILKHFQKGEQTMAEAGVSSTRTKIGVKAATKAEFDTEQEAMGCATADEAVSALVADHKVYRALREAVGDEMEALCAILVEAQEVAKDGETALECLRAALADKKRFRGGYEKRAEKAAERDLSSLSLAELKNIRTPEASRERWRRAVDQIMAYNDAAAYPELRWFVNAASVKALVGGRGTEIKQYLEQEWQTELDEHHKKYALRPGHNHARSNIRERVLGEASSVLEEEE